jgi:hypothetical protein
MGQSEEEGTLERLREEVEKSKTLYSQAKHDLKRAREIARDLGLGHPDGGFALALRNHNDKLMEYSRALRRYNRYVLDGKLPED